MIIEGKDFSIYLVNVQENPLSKFLSPIEGKLKILWFFTDDAHNTKPEYLITKKTNETVSKILEITLTETLENGNFKFQDIFIFLI